jgi:flagellar P-ring protein precursor FlgI
VQSVANLLRRFDIEVPAEMLRTRNVAAVLVTAEVSPYLRAGGRFEVHVSSLGDASSLRGGVLWMTPLVAEAGGQPYATAQGPLLLSEATDTRRSYGSENTARLPDGGLLENELPRPAFASSSKLLLRQPDIGTATRIAAAINADLGDGTAKVEDPGAISLTFKDANADRATTLARIRDIKVKQDRPARIIIDSRDGTIVAGGDVTVGEAVVSHGGITLSVGEQAVGGTQPSGGTQGGSVRMAAGTTVQQVATALHAAQSTAGEIAAIFESLRDVGAIAAEVVIR